MKKLLLALSAMALFTGSASAADLGVGHMYTKAPTVAPAYSWSGFYVFGGAGGGLWDADSNIVSAVTGAAVTNDQRLGGDGWFGTVGAGYDWQFNTRWVAGVFADGQFGSLRGSISDPEFAMQGTEKLQTSYAAGARLGYLIAPNVLSYVNAGYSGSEWSGTSYSAMAAVGGAGVFTTPSFHRDGWFVGGGVENSLDIFGVHIPGLFIKTEYRAAHYDRIRLPENLIGGGVTLDSITFKPFVQTISTSLVYRFNWGGPVVANQ